MKSKSKKILISTLAVLALAILAVIYIISSSLNKPAAISPPVSPPEVIIDKIKNAQIKGDTLELKAEDLNAVAKNMVDKGINKAGISVKKVYTEIKDDKIFLYAQTEYKNTEVLLSSSGKLSYENNRVIFTPEGFKVGNLPLPKGLVMDRIKDYSPDNIIVSTDRIEVPKEFFPFDIETLDIEDDKIKARIKKITISEIFSPISISVEEDQKSYTKNGQNSGQTNKSTPAPSNSTGVNNKSTDNKPVTQMTVEKKRALLKNISGQLGSSLGDVKTSKEKQVISATISAINQMAQNTSGGIVTGGVQSLYEKLTSEEKARVKAAIFKNVDMRTAAELARLFGM